MTAAAEIMHPGGTGIDGYETLAMVAQRMRELVVGALPFCGDESRVRGMVPDRSSILNYVAVKGNLATLTASELAEEKVCHADALASVRQMIDVMEQHQVRRLPVIDDGHRIVRSISEADIAHHLPGHEIARFVKPICSQRAVVSDL